MFTYCCRQQLSAAYHMNPLLQIFKKVGLSAIRLLFIPGVVEAFFDGALAVAFFNMPVTFAFALGFILKAVGPALVIQCMFEVQQKRLGVAKCEDVVCAIQQCPLAAVPLFADVQHQPVLPASYLVCTHMLHTSTLPTMLLCLSVYAACQSLPVPLPLLAGWSAACVQHACVMVPYQLAGTSQLSHDPSCP